MPDLKYPAMKIYKELTGGYSVRYKTNNNLWVKMGWGNNPEQAKEESKKIFNAIFRGAEAWKDAR
jgi:hypothetical protein